MPRYKGGAVALVIAVIAVPSAQAELNRWTVKRVKLHYTKRVPGDRCKQVVYEDGSGTVCTRSYRIRLDP